MAKNADAVSKGGKYGRKNAPTVNLRAAAKLRSPGPKPVAKAVTNSFQRAKVANPRPKLPPQQQSYRPMNFTGSRTMASPMDVGAPITPAPAPEPPKPKTWDELSEAEQTNYLKGDATYTAQQAALEQELKNLIAELGLQRTNYSTDYTSALSNMGWNADQKSFDPNNLLGAYGASFANQENDFANRGMLDSSGYANALTNLNTSFDKQKGDLDTSRANFLRELETRETGARNTHTQDLQRARADAIARRAAREGLV